MAHTKHGYHIPGTVLFPEEKNISKRRCGGPKLCEKCVADCKLYWTEIAAMMETGYVGAKMNEPTDFLEKAKLIVRNWVNAHQDIPEDGYSVYIVWFTKTLQNWKAIASTTMPDQMIYELTYNGDKRETYLDAYKKVENISFPD
jgi:hypothetical protein